MHVTNYRNRTGLNTFYREKNMDVFTDSDALSSHSDLQVGGECPGLTSGNKYYIKNENKINKGIFLLSLL